MSDKMNTQTTVLKSTEDSDGNIFVFGAALVPEVTDHQGDIISEDEIRKACRDYMERSQAAGISHKAIVAKSNAYLTQCFVAPCDFTIEDTETTIAKGSMVVEYCIPPEAEDLQKSIKDGTFNGFSIGGNAGNTEIEEVSAE